MRGGRSIDDLEVEVARLVKIVERLQRGVSVGTGEPGAEALIKSVVEDAPADRRVGHMLGHHRVPFAFDVEHHRAELERGVETGGAQAARVDPRRLAAQARQS